MTYRRTASIPLPDHPEYGLSRSTVPTTDTQHEERYLQIIHLPDERGRIDCETDAVRMGRGVYELTVREPRELTDDEGTPQLVSPILQRHGPYSRAGALARAVELADSLDLPIYTEVARLRPDNWTDSADWVSCPRCNTSEIALVTNLDDSALTLRCRGCDATVTNSERKELFTSGCTAPVVGVVTLTSDSAPRKAASGGPATTACTTLRRPRSM